MVSGWISHRYRGRWRGSSRKKVRLRSLHRDHRREDAPHGRHGAGGTLADLASRSRSSWSPPRRRPTPHFTPAGWASGLYREAHRLPAASLHPHQHRRDPQHPHGKRIAAPPLARQRSARPAGRRLACNAGSIPPDRGGSQHGLGVIRRQRTGKELVARTIHDLSPRRNKPLSPLIARPFPRR